MTAQGTEARRGETAGLDAKRDGPVGVADAPNSLAQKDISMTDTTEQQAVPVAQIDVDAAAALDDALGFLTEIERPIVVEHFARYRHRLASVSSASAEARSLIPHLLGHADYDEDFSDGLRQHLRDAARLLTASPEPVPATNQAAEVERPRMTGEEWKALPENTRRYIMMLETDADPSGTIRSEMILRDYVELLEARINETNGCFDAAVAEGLYERLQEVEPDEQAYASLVDLVQRRLMYAYTPAPKRPSMRPDRHPGWTEAGHQWLDAGCPDQRAIADLHRLQHGKISPVAKPMGGRPILRWAVDEIKALRAALATQPATSQEGEVCALCSGKGFADAQCPVCMIAATPTPPTLATVVAANDEGVAKAIEAAAQIADAYSRGPHAQKWHGKNIAAAIRRDAAAIRLLSQGGGK